LAPTDTPTATAKHANGGGDRYADRNRHADAGADGGADRNQHADAGADGD
jgi:hypothetical protein